MAGIALKGQADLISIKVVPLEVLVLQKKMKKKQKIKKKTGKYCSIYQYETRFVRHICHLSLFVFFGKIFV